MAQLHEVLAVDKDLENVSNKVVEEAVNTFSKKVEHFTGSDKRLEMFDDSRKHEEEGFREVRELTTTIDRKLDYVWESIIKHFDCVAQKEITNTVASADVVLPDGTTLFTNLPASLLLTMENKLLRLRKMYEEIPTLQPGVDWVPDTERGVGVFRAKNEEVKHKTEKVIQHKVLVQPTDKHPAQVEKWTEDKPVGQYKTIRWSGMVSPAKKSQLLNKLDTLVGSFKQARMRANTATVLQRDIGKMISDYMKY